MLFVIIYRMTRLLAFPLSIFLAASLLAEDELPKDPSESLDIEPPFLIQEMPSRSSVQASPRKWEDGVTFGITAVTSTDSPDADAERKMKVTIDVKVRPNTVIDPTKVKIQVFFYDTVDNRDVVLTDAGVSYKWLTPHHDWKDANPQVLTVTMRPKNKVNPSSTVKNQTTKEPHSKGIHRKYLGYIVRIYYGDQRQAVRADPGKLLDLFPPPLTIPSK
jgi:hypothetical protein